MNGRPSPYRLDYPPEKTDYWDVSAAAIGLTKQACTSSARLLEDRGLRMRFNRDVAYYAKRITADVDAGKKSPVQGLAELRQTSKRLSSMTIDIAVKGIGLVAGIGQVTAGAGICIRTRGYLCGSVGAPLLAHGLNNVYENGRNLFENRSDVKGPLRSGYGALSEAMGGSESEAKIAYAAVDVALSIYTLLRMVLKPDSWHLFRFIPSDYALGYKTMSSGALSVEAAANGISLGQIKDELAQ